MGQHWSQKKGVISGQEAQRRATSARRAAEFKAARKGKGTAPEYRATAAGAGCLAALALFPIVLTRALLRGRGHA